MSSDSGNVGMVDWEAFRESMGYSPQELERFRAHPNNVFVVENACRLDEWEIVAEVIESHGCAAGHNVGSKLFFSPHGVLLADKAPERVCLHALTTLGPAVAVFQERIIAGLSPDPYLFRHVGCLDVGVTCGGWGHIAFKLYALPAAP